MLGTWREYFDHSARRVKNLKFQCRKIILINRLSFYLLNYFFGLYITCFLSFNFTDLYDLIFEIFVDKKIIFEKIRLILIENIRSYCKYYTFRLMIFLLGKYMTLCINCHWSKYSKYLEQCFKYPFSLFAVIYLFFYHIEKCYKGPIIRWFLFFSNFNFISIIYKMYLSFLREKTTSNHRSIFAPQPHLESAVPLDSSVSTGINELPSLSSNCTKSNMKPTK
uniref:Very-long-chain 3-oxoacyl-CoA synthase n=1 Tax=Heterorhabditis bacteriophora TaxID=37862 RepID=A0A1I7WJA8_HETBA